MPLAFAFLLPVVSGFAALAAPLAAPDRLDLPSAISFALEHNFAIRQARERIREQHGIVSTVSAAGLPNVAGAGSYQQSDVPVVQTATGQPPVFLPAGHSWRMGLTVTQTVYSGGRVRASITGAELVREAAILELKATVNEALLNVRVGFYNVLLAREQVLVQEQNLALLKSQLHTTTARAEAGTTSDFERLRAEVAVANAKVPLIQARNDFRLAVEDLRRVLGFTTNDPESARKVPEFVGNLAVEPVTFDLEKSFVAAWSNRPDLQRLAKLIAAAHAGVKVARAGYLPDLKAKGGYDLRTGNNERFRDSREGFFVGAQSHLEIQGRAVPGRVMQAEAQDAIAQLSESEARLTVEVEVRRAFSALQQATELSAAAQKTVDQAVESARLATARYDVGAATQLDVLRSQVELTTAQTSQLRANHGFNVAIAQLRWATGVGEVGYGR
ncbi:MAG: TolC family protein [Opitutaceae bacterium]|nr:TolC family protein [Opitutaceae bacterium]